MSVMVSFCAAFFPRDVLDEILDLIESVSVVAYLLLKARGPGFDTQSGHILSFRLPLIQEGQYSVTSESMCTKYWFTA